jgi:hypothetical protein
MTRFARAAQITVEMAYFQRQREQRLDALQAAVENYEAREATAVNPADGREPGTKCSTCWERNGAHRAMCPESPDTYTAERERQDDEAS